MLNCAETKKITKLILGLSVALTSSAVFSASFGNPVVVANEGSPFNGFYIGADIGTAIIQANTIQNFTASGDSTVGTVLIPMKANVTEKSLMGQLDVAFGYVFKEHYYLGLEGSGSLESLNPKATLAVSDNEGDAEVYSKVNLNREYALTLNPGFVVQNNTLFYGKAGATWGDFDVKSGFESGLSSISGNDFSGSFGTQHEGTETGLLLGLGIERFITQHFSLKLEYDYADYGDIHCPPKILTVNSNSAVYTNKADSVNNNTILFGVNYHF